MECSIKYINGDVRCPSQNGYKLIIHCCNDIGAMGAGVALSIAKKWPIVKQAYRNWHKDQPQSFKLGEIQRVPVEEDISVVNMIGQHGIGFKDGKPPIRYEAIRECLKKVCNICKKFNCSVHAPKFGSDLAGGNWDIIEQIINEELIEKDIEVIVYLFES